MPDAVVRFMWQTSPFIDTISLKERLQKKGVIMNTISNITQDIVLIVEDTAANHEVIRTFLSDIGVRCESAFDGMEAVTKCGLVEKNYYSLILMDINLPKLNGFETAAKLQSLGIKAPIIAITASSKDDARLNDARDLFDALLFKPFNSAEFFTAISPYIRNALQYALPSGTVLEKENSTFTANPQICDIHRAVNNMGGSFRLFEKHFNNFKRNNADLAFRMESLIQQNHLPECSALCHSIKGLSGMLGLTALYDHIIVLEECLNKASDSPMQGEAVQHNICELLATIKNDIRLVCKVQV